MTYPALNTLTPEARHALSLVPSSEVQSLVNLAKEVAIANQDEEIEQRKNERFQALFSKVAAKVSQLLQENAALQEALKECEEETVAMETSLKMQLRAINAAVSAAKAQSEAQVATHKAAMAIFEKQIEMVEGERRALQNELLVLTEEQRKLLHNDALLREIVKHSHFMWHEFPYFSAAVRTAFAQIKK